MRQRERERLLAHLKALTTALHANPMQWDEAWDAIMELGKIIRGRK